MPQSSSSDERKEARADEDHDTDDESTRPRRQPRGEPEHCRQQDEQSAERGARSSETEPGGAGGRLSEILSHFASRQLDLELGEV